MSASQRAGRSRSHLKNMSGVQPLNHVRFDCSNGIRRDSRTRKLLVRFQGPDPSADGHSLPRHVVNKGLLHGSGSDQLWIFRMVYLEPVCMSSDHPSACAPSSILKPNTPTRLGASWPCSLQICRTMLPVQIIDISVFGSVQSETNRGVSRLRNLVAGGKVSASVTVAARME